MCITLVQLFDRRKARARCQIQGPILDQERREADGYRGPGIRTPDPQYCVRGYLRRYGSE